MWTWLILGYALVLLALIGAAGGVALFVTDHRHGARAHKILKTLLAALAGSAGLFTIVLRLHQAGLL
jgi:hypothetical protein